MADLLQVASLARSTLYYQCNAIQRTEPSGLEAKVRAVHDDHKGRYGYRRITAALRNSLGESVNDKCVQRLMQKMGLPALIPDKKRSRDVPGIIDVHVQTS